MIRKQDICGIILAGGKSSRMGYNKALLKYKNQSFIDTAINLIRPFCSEILISSNPDIHTPHDYPIIEDIYKDCGPAGGIFSSLKASSKKSNLIIPIDIPKVSTGLIEHLIDQADPKNISVIRLPNGFIEPLCGIYPKSALSIVESFINKGNYKIMSILQAVNIKTIDINESMSFYKKDMFINVNTPKDYKQI